MLICLKGKAEREEKEIDRQTKEEREPCLALAGSIPKAQDSKICTRRQPGARNGRQGFKHYQESWMGSGVARLENDL